MDTAQYLHFTGQGHVVSLSCHELRLETPSTKSKTRGEITHFSKKSRKRLLTQAARLDLETYLKDNRAIFITLTYGQTFPSPKTAKKHLFTLLKRFRRLAPQASGIWRLEFQKRGAPHLHIVLFNFPYFSKDDLKVAWKEIVGDAYCDWSSGTPIAPFTRIEAISNTRKVVSYVAKYVAKVEADSSSGFNDVPYLTAGENIGRLWGVFNRQNLPLAELVTLTIETDRETCHTLLWQFRRLMAKRYKRAAKAGRFKGATMFVTTVHPWEKALLWCILEYCHDKSYLTHHAVYV